MTSLFWADSMIQRSACWAALSAGTMPASRVRTAACSLKISTAATAPSSTASACRRTHRPDADNFSVSRTIVRRALSEGVGLISDDVKSDRRFDASQTLAGLELRSLMCVPMIDAEGRRLGVLQIDRSGKGFGFRVEDL